MVEELQAEWAEVFVRDGTIGAFTDIDTLLENLTPSGWNQGSRKAVNPDTTSRSRAPGVALRRPRDATRHPTPS
jgi:hypothetical protein